MKPDEFDGLWSWLCWPRAGGGAGGSRHQMMCVDIDADKIEWLIQGIVPISNRLESLVRENHASRRITFTTMPRRGQAWRIQMIVVGTPPGEKGSADLKYVLAVAVLRCPGRVP
ncbi:UDP-glucose dehydrogenase homolog (plasmid) [Mesorhizobium japonicum MAFF 303099]|uniref:UDP-glucose 6-dehydrogenase n=1 Tax=Mesorhizobium japonicum (strain LMG 29417 / CECT 9101 / MAFF 303099) TaxID=266835 RepID=Q98NV9_RHILO|nr:UDP-glucose dehydrogenase homolog [Mesorhizobium japonicum MAFF 303099]